MLASEVSDRAARVLLFAAGCFFIERDLFHMVYAYSSVWLLRGCHFEGYDCMCISCLSPSLPLLKKTVSILDESTLAAEQLTPVVLAINGDSLCCILRWMQFSRELTVLLKHVAPAIITRVAGVLGEAGDLCEEVKASALNGVLSEKSQIYSTLAKSVAKVTQASQVNEKTVKRIVIFRCDTNTRLRAGPGSGC